MLYPEVVVLLVLAGALVLFVTELIPLGVTGLGIVAVLGLSGVLTPERAVAAFSSPVVLLVGSLYVVSAGLVRTGVVGTVDRYLVHLGEASERRLLLVTTLGAAAISTLLNNTSVVVLMLPLLLGAASRLGVPPSRVLMPLSFAAILGGTMTLIGTSTNVLVADLASTSFEIGFLDFLPVGAVFVTVGMLYLWFVAPRILPLRPTISSVTKGRAFEYVTELRVRHAGPAVGSTPAELARRVGEKIRILQLVRGEEVLDQLSPHTVLQPDDILILRGTPETIVELRRDLRLELLAGGVGPTGKAAHGTTFAEIVVTPASELIGRTLKEIGLNRTFGVVAVALQRRGAHLRHSIVELPLQVGDVIMVQGSPEDVAGLHGQPGFLLLVGVEEEVVLRRRAPCAITILALFVVLAAAGAAHLSILALGAAVACLLTGCIRLRRAVAEMNWNVLGLLAGAVTLGVALYTTGLADRASDLTVGLAHNYGPVAVLASVYLVTAIATEFVTNSGAAALMVPIALASAEHLGLSPKPFVFAVAYAASASFATPIGYQTNAFIYGPGGYRFRDYLRIGLPLQILLWIVATAIIPVFFPFD